MKLLKREDHRDNTAILIEDELFIHRHRTISCEDCALKKVVNGQCFYALIRRGREIEYDGAKLTLLTRLPTCNGLIKTWKE